MGAMQTNLDELLKARAEIDAQLRQHKDTLTVLFTDVVGSTSYYERFGDTEGLAMVHRHAELASEVVSEFNGSVIKTIGDSVMAEFADPVWAVRAAVEIELRQLRFNLAVTEAQRLQVRIGVHRGLGFRKGTDVFGDVVNVAARITKRSGPAQILVSQAVQDAIQHDSQLTSHWQGTVTLDGRAEKEDVFEVIWTDAASYREIRQGATGVANLPSRYEMLGQVGTGGAGIVYRVRDLETGEIIALKILKPEIASDPTVQESFKNELCLARKITHKNVCRIHEFTRSNGTVYTSMEFVEGETLLSLLNRSGALPLSRALEIARQICAGLSEAHAQGIVHCDLKPANLMVDRTGIVKIMDFGVARLAQAGGKLTGTIVGTPAYMAPEQAASKPVDGRTDIYALGLVIYEMVTGTPAFDGDTPVAIALKQIRETPKRPRKLVSSLPARMESAIMKCLEKDPADRFQSVDALATALKEEAAASAISRSSVELARLRQSASSLCTTLRRRVDTLRPSLQLLHEKLLAARKINIEPKVALPAALLLGALVAFTAGGSWIRSANGSARAKTAIPMIARSASAPETKGSTPAPTADSVRLNVTPERGGSAQGSTVPVDFHSRQNFTFDSGLKGQAEGSTEKKTAPARAKLLEPRKPATTRPTEKQGSPNFGVSQSRPQELGPTQFTLPQSSGNSLAAPVSSQPGTTGHSGSVASAAARSHEPAASPADKSLPSKKAEVKPDSPEPVYLEVGTFKDAAWADNAVEKLVQLGFPAMSVHKGHLWVKSYHVQVGPYADAKKMEAAEKRLESQGFKPHVVK
jgi:serine/threonine protein kinase/class 3 adenylate cyclase